LRILDGAADEAVLDRLTLLKAKAFHPGRDAFRPE
jgi:hypothetical protein